MTRHVWMTQVIHINSQCKEILSNTWTVCSRILLHMNRSAAFLCSCDWSLKSIVLHLKQKASQTNSIWDFKLFPLFKRAATLKEKKALSSLTVGFVELNITEVESNSREPLTSSSIVCWFWNQMHWFRQNNNVIY